MNHTATGRRVDRARRGIAARHVVGRHVTDGEGHRVQALVTGEACASGEVAGDYEKVTGVTRFTWKNPLS